MTRMTDEDVSRVTALVSNAPVNPALPIEVAQKLVDHIAALTAERDEALDRAQAAESTATENGEECDALRERVRALEAENEARCAEMNAIRQRAGDEERIRSVSWSAHLGYTTEDKHKSSGMAVARYILGDDAPPSEMDGTPCEGHDIGEFCGACGNTGIDRRGGPSEADGLTGEMADTRDLERTDYKAPPARDVVESPTPAEPTTAEAFATARAGIDAAESPALNTGEKTAARRVGKAALSMLERRLGAMGRAGRAVVDAFSESSATLTQRSEAMDALEDVLTDASEVYTREDNPLRVALLEALTYIADRSAGSSKAWMAAIGALGLDPDATTGEVFAALRK